MLFRQWVNATKGKYGYLLANMAGNVVNFALALNTSGSSTIAHFFYLSNKVSEKLISQAYSNTDTY